MLLIPLSDVLGIPDDQGRDRGQGSWGECREAYGGGNRFLEGVQSPEISYPDPPMMVDDTGNASNMCT